MKTSALNKKIPTLLILGLCVWGCSLPWSTPDSSQGARLSISLEEGGNRGLGLVVPTPALSNQITSYRLTVGTVVRSNLAQTDLASQGDLPVGDQSIKLEALKGSQVIMTHTPVTANLQPGVETPLSITLKGLQTGSDNAKLNIRFFLDSSLGTGLDGPVSDVKFLVADTVAKLGISGSFESIPLGAPVLDPVSGLEYVELNDPGVSSGRWFAKVLFFGQKGTAPFAFAPILTLDLYDYAEHNLVRTLTGNELDGKPLAPSAPEDPAVPGSFLPVESGSHDGTFLTLTWEDNSWVEEGYLILRRLDTDTEFTLVGSVDANITSWSETADGTGASTTGLLRDRTYYYRIVAHTAQWEAGEPLDVGPLVTSPKAVLYVDQDLEGIWGGEYDYTANPVASPRGPHFIPDGPDQWNLAVYNAGFWPLELSGISFSGTHDLDYTLASPDAYFNYDWALGDTGPARTVQTLPQKVVAGDVLFIRLEWDPQGPGLRSTDVTLTTDDPGLKPLGTVDNFITLLGEAADIDDYQGRWDLDPLGGVGQLVGFDPYLLANRNSAVPADLEIGGFQTFVGDRFSLPADRANAYASFGMAGNGTDYLQVKSGHPFDLDTGGTLTFWAGLFLPKPGETWTLLNTMDAMSSPTRGFALELVTDLGGSTVWRLQAAGHPGVTQAYAGELDYRWNLVSLEYDPVTTSFILKVDGTEILTTTQTLVSNTGDPIGWGSRPYEPSINHTSHWKGALDDLRIYNRPLSETEHTLLLDENSWVPDLTPPAEADEARVNRAFPGVNGGRFFLNWDLTSQPVGEVSRIQVELTPMMAAAPRIYRILPSALVNGEFLLEDPGYSPAVGNTFDITFRTMDWNGNLSAGIPYTGLVIQDPGSVSGMVNLDSGNLYISSSSFYAIGDSGEIFQPVGEPPEEALPSSTSVSDLPIHGAVGPGNSLQINMLMGYPLFDVEGPDKPFISVYLRFSPGQVATAEWLLDGGIPIPAVILRDVDYDNYGTPELRDIVATPNTLLTAAGLAAGHHTLTLRVTDQKGRIFSGQASFEVEDTP